MNSGIPEIRQLRHSSQPPVSNKQSLIDKEEARNSNFPLISKNSRVETPGYIGEEAYSNFYNKFK